MYNPEWANKNYYDVLEVDSTASKEEISKKYRKLARTYHPDMMPDGDDSKFKEVSEAYDVIGDTEKRKSYDAQRSGGGFGSFGNLFDSGLFNQASSSGTSNIDIDALLRNFAQSGNQTSDEKFVNDLLNNSKKETTENDSSFLNDIGDWMSRAKQSTSTKFSNSFGSKGDKVEQVKVSLTFEESLKASTREIEINDTKIKFRIPAGVKDGQKLRITKPLTVDIKIEVKSSKSFYWFDGLLTVRAPISLSKALYGGSHAFTLPTGTEVRFTLPERCANRAFKLAGKGINGDDVIVQPYISLPEADNSKELADLLIQEIS